MSLRRPILLLALIVLAAFGSTAASASATPVWNLDMHHNQTNFPSGGTAQYWFDVDNVGDTATSGQITLTVKLPAGITRNSTNLSFDFGAMVNWSCPGSPGDSTVICTTTDPIRRHTLSRSLVLVVNVAPSASGDRFASAKVEGGGAATPASTPELTHIDSEPAGFGIVPESFKADFYGSDGLTPVRESGAHPDLASFAFDFNSVASPTTSNPEQKVEAGTIRDLEVELPPGFVGYPTAVGECTPAELSFNACPLSSQVGRADLAIYPIAGEGIHPVSTGVFNMTHPRGSVTDLAFVFTGIPVHIEASLDPAHHYAIRTTVSDINESLPPFNQKLTIWGVPADHGHDSERCENFALEGGTSQECSTDQPFKPFLTAPSGCGEHAMALRDYDSWQNTGAFGPEITYQMPGETTACDKPRFEPEVVVHPTGSQANTPTGLEVHLKVPQNSNPNALATPPVKSVKVTLPQGMTVSPSFADGLSGCSEAQIGLGTDDAVTCPDSSRIGAVSLTTPLLPKPVEGSLYLAAQGANPFGSTFAVYLAVHDLEERGVLVKIPGKLELDPVTGQITTTFDELPQFPFEDFTLAFRSGQRAPLINPPSCGAQTIGAQIASYAQPGNLLDVSNTYQVTEGPSGTPCPPSPASRPFAPKMDAGTVNPAAGSYSPFAFRLTREDSEQEIGTITTVLAPGITAKIAGIPSCPEATIAAIPSAEGTGRGQAEHPSCPVASQIGTVNTGVGAGTDPNYFEGKAYLAGPYKGAPLSMAIVVPALAGPYDLGNVVVRAAIYVDPASAQVKVVSDPLPTILHGVLLRVRGIRLNVNRPQTTLNPTSCNPMAIGGTATSVTGAQASLQSPFQVANCAALGFAPRLSFKLKGGTHRGDYPALEATLRARPGDANIAKAAVTLPHSVFLAQEHIRTICTRAQFAVNACPAGSIYGRAKAVSPLLDEPLEGPVYLRSSANPLPDLVAKLNGRFEVDLVGRIDSVNQGIRNTFDVVPDAPVSTFTLQMQGGKKSLLVNSRNLCKGSARAEVKLSAQNGKTSLTRPAMATSCKGKAKKQKRHRKRSRR
jgi:hypothetical protein